MDEVGPVLGAPVEPPADVWANAVAGALEDHRSADEFARLVPESTDPDVDPPEQSLLEEKESEAADDSEWDGWPAALSDDNPGHMLTDPGDDIIDPDDDPGSGYE